MRRYSIFILFVIILFSCNRLKVDKYYYQNGNPEEFKYYGAHKEPDSNIRYFEDGKILERYYFRPRYLWVIYFHDGSPSQVWLKDKFGNVDWTYTEKRDSSVAIIKISKNIDDHSTDTILNISKDPGGKETRKYDVEGGSLEAAYLQGNLSEVRVSGKNFFGTIERTVLIQQYRNGKLLRKEYHRTYRPYANDLYAKNWEEERDTLFKNIIIPPDSQVVDTAANLIQSFEKRFLEASKKRILDH